MPRNVVFAERCNNDQDIILRSVMPVIDTASVIMRANLQDMLENGTRFGVKGYLVGSLQHQLATTMLAGHLAGARRAILLEKQSPRYVGPTFSYDEGYKQAALELSVFSNVISYLKKRFDFNLSELQKKYSTLALKVLSSASDAINSELEKTLQKLIKEGAHVRQAKIELAAKFDQLGLRPASRGQFETIFRTQTQISYAAGKYNAEREYPLVAEKLWGYKYVTTGDDRVRPTHAALEGVTLPKDDPFWRRFYPPNGWNCRCQAIPLFEPYAIVVPPKYINGVKITPDKGFAWNAGAIFNPMSI